MATYQITINERTSEGKKFLLYMKALPFVSFVDNKKLNSMEKALEDVEKGNLTEIKDLEEYFGKYIK